ncbi:hypothetical protein, partial [Enterobacter roggenkampii]|uniref:hypothetical protein n=1 Tax=Enterobacter roggenkampii TaxID=1812935 RepID=UPI00200356D0
SIRVNLKKLTPSDGAGNSDPVPELTVNEVADALIPAASTVCALLAAKSVSAIYPPGFGQQKTRSRRVLSGKIN